MAGASFGSLTGGLVVAYVIWTAYQIGGLFLPPRCADGGATVSSGACVEPAVPPGAALRWELWVAPQTLQSLGRDPIQTLRRRAADGKGAGAAATGETGGALGEDALALNATLPLKELGTRAKNGTLHAHVFVFAAGGEEKGARPLGVVSARLTRHLPVKLGRGRTMLLGASSSSDAAAAANATAEGNATGEADEAAPPSPWEDGEVWTHLRPRLVVRHVANPPRLRRKGFPPELGKFVIRQGGGNANDALKYRPLLAADDLTLLRRDYVVLKKDPDAPDPVIELTIQPTNIGVFRFLGQMELAVEQLQTQFGLAESDVEEVKELFASMNLKWLAITYAVGILHSFFAFLAFKNDVGFWRQKSSLEGLSVRTFFSNFICQFIIFLKLCDSDQTSMLILVEVGIGTAIEGWKVSKIAFRRGYFDRLLGANAGADARAKTQAEQDTDEHDAYAMRILGYFLYPVVGAYGAYSLVYHPQRGWYSWVLETLANAVYMFGFIAMTPQLYINYKLKSVAHLPWRAFMYKMFNTFIDDVFAFAIAMPMTHRLACLRDDIVFVILLYQRYIYPVDKKRVNEFGRAYEHEDEKAEAEKKDD